MASRAPFPFRVQKPFVLHGVVQERGAVIDVSGLPDVRVRQMENAGLGLRVPEADTPSRGRGGAGSKPRAAKTPSTVTDN